MESRTKLFLFWTCVFALLCCTWLGARVYNAVQFNIHCRGHLKRAADSSTIEMAQEELHLALVYMEKNELTSGSTHVFWENPSTDIGFFYKNLNSANEELNQLIDRESTPLEKTNVLIKLRETILDEGESLVVTTPSGISIYPNVSFFFWSGWFFLFGAALFPALLIKEIT